MRYRVAGSYSEEGQWRGVGLLCESQPGRLMLVTPRDHGKILTADLDTLIPDEHPLLAGLELTDVREVDRPPTNLSPERFLMLLRNGPGAAGRRKRRARPRPQIDYKAYEEE